MRFISVKNLQGNFDVIDTQKLVTIEDNISRSDARETAKMKNEKANARKQKTAVSSSN